MRIIFLGTLLVVVSACNQGALPAVKSVNPVTVQEARLIAKEIATKKCGYTLISTGESDAGKIIFDCGDTDHTFRTVSTHSSFWWPSSQGNVKLRYSHELQIRPELKVQGSEIEDQSLNPFFYLICDSCERPVPLPPTLDYRER